MCYLIHVYIAGGFEYVYEMVHFLFPNNKMMIMTRFDTVPSIADGVPAGTTYVHPLNNHMHSIAFVSFAVINLLTDK